MKKEKIINVRIDEATEKKLKGYTIQEDTTQTSIVSEALAMYFSAKQQYEHPYELGQDLFGSASSGKTDLSTSYKSKIKEKISAKHTH